MKLILSAHKTKIKKTNLKYFRITFFILFCVALVFDGTRYKRARAGETNLIHYQFISILYSFNFSNSLAIMVYHCFCFSILTECKVSSSYRF